VDIVSLKLAVEAFDSMRQEFAPLSSLGLPAPSACVRQRHHATDTDQGWAFTRIGVVLDQGLDGTFGTFWGEFQETDPKTRCPRTSRVYMDAVSVDSVELTVYDEADD